MRHNVRSQRTTGPDAAAFILFLFTLCFAPLAFGTTETWSLAAVEFFTAAAGLLLFFPRAKHPVPLYSIPGLLPLLLLICWMYVQCIPLPPQLIRMPAPHIFEIYQPFLDLPGAFPWIPLTLHLKATLLESLRISSYALFYILTVQLLSRSSRLRYTVHLVVILALCIAFFAFLQKFSSPHKIYWFRQIPASAWQGALGPWVYPNHYAGFMVMLAPLALGLFMYYRPAAQADRSIRERIISLCSTPGVNLRLLLAFGIVLLIASIFLSQSRGGILSITCAVLLYAALYHHKYSGRIHIHSLFLVCALILAAGLFNGQPVLEKFISTFTAPGGGIQDGRLKVWQDALSIIRDFPLTGTGFGTFSEVYLHYKSFIDIYFYDHAHNDYIELFTDGGVIGFGLAAWFILTIVNTGLTQLSVSRDNFAVQFSIASLCGIAGLLLYSITDFNLHNGANGLYFFFLCGLLVSAGHTRHHSSLRPTLLSPVRSPFIRTISCTVVLLLLAALLPVMGGTIMAARLYNQAEVIASSMRRPAKKRAAMAKLLNRAKNLDPLAGRYDYALAHIEAQRGNNKTALQYYQSAARKQPMETAFLHAAEIPAATARRPDSRQQAIPSLE
jgi:O-antigen ligase